MRIEMGNSYFKLDNTTATKEKLDAFLSDLGFEKVKRESTNLDDYDRCSKFTDGKNLTFDVIWYRNLCHIRIGKWGESFIEIPFTEIIGCYLPNVGHNTADFYNDDSRTGTLSIKYAGETK